MLSRDWAALVALGLLLATVALVAPFGFASDWTLVDDYAQWIMAIASAFGAIMSALALVAAAFVYSQSKEANNLTRQQMYSSARPFLRMAEVELKEYTSPDGEYNWWVSVKVENISDFPATDVSMKFSVKKRPLYIGTNAPVAKLCQAFAESPSSPSTIVLAWTSDPLMAIGNDDLPDEGSPRSLLLSVAIRYKSTVNPNFYVVGAAYHIGSLADMYAQASDDEGEHTHSGVLIAETQVAT